MIDYILKYATEAAAKTALASRLVNDAQGIPQWPQDYCIAGVTVWRDSQDLPDGQGGFTHTPLAGFRRI
jgi:hypothetical protein